MAHSKSQHTSGRLAETFAQTWLEKKSWRCIAKNYRCRFGEIDLIMQQGQQIIFVEVKFRRNSGWGGAIESISLTKQKKIIVSAKHFLSQHTQYQHHNLRFDAILISKDICEKNIHWLQNAFTH